MFLSAVPSRSSRQLHLRAGFVLLLAASTASFSGCAHTKTLGQSLVAVGAMVVGLSVLDAAGVTGSKCSTMVTVQGNSVESCSGNSVVPQPVNIAGIVFGAGLIGGGALLWTSDKQNPAPQQAQSNTKPRTTPLTQ